MTIAIVTDSNSGITQAQAGELGISVLPMPFMIDGETYFEDITLTQEQFYEKLAQNADISTSQPSPESVMELWDSLLKEYDEIVHIPMSSSLCSTKIPCDLDLCLLPSVLLCLEGTISLVTFSPPDAYNLPASASS